MEQNQLTLFGFLPPRSDAVKKIITRERVEEMKALWAKGDKRGAIERLRELRYRLEGLERSIRVRPPNKKP